MSSSPSETKVSATQKTSKPSAEDMADRILYLVGHAPRHKIRTELVGYLKFVLEEDVSDWT